MSAKKVYATAENSPSVRAGFEMGGYEMTCKPGHHPKSLANLRREKGIPQTPKQKFAGSLNFLRRTVMGSWSNLSHWPYELIRSRPRDQLTYEASQELDCIYSRSQELAQELKKLSDQIASFSSSKKWID